MEPKKYWVVQENFKKMDFICSKNAETLEWKTFIGKKYSSTCTFAMYITKKSRRLQKILLDFFVIYITKAMNSSDRMNYTFGVKTWEGPAHQHACNFWKFLDGTNISTVNKILKKYKIDVLLHYNWSELWIMLHWL